MKKSTKVGFALVATAAMAAGTFASANALWSAHASSKVPPFSTGNVYFSAFGAQDAVLKQVSEAGAAVKVSLPGSKIIEVLQQDAVGAEPVVWRFTVEGNALGIAGLDYTVALQEQTSSEGSYALADGIARQGTVLAGTTTQIYRAGAGGDCSAVPEVPEEDQARNVYLHDAVSTQLHAPGAGHQDGSAIVQEWCVAMNWNQKLDGMYVNSVWATGTADDGTESSSFDIWNAPVGFPPSLDLMGTYRNEGTAEGTAKDSTKAKSMDEWYADIYPDPDGEPDVVISIDPVVTNLNPAVKARD